MAQLTLCWSSDDADTGVLDAHVTSGDFSGHAHAWFRRRDLEEGFIARLRSYPIPPSDPVKLEGSDWISFSPDGMGPVELGIRISPYNSRGALLVCVELSSKIRTNPDADLHHATVVRFVTDYETLGKFASDFQAVLREDRETAALESTAFS